MIPKMYKLVCPQCGCIELTGKKVELVNYKCKKCKSEWFATFYEGIFLTTEDVETHKKIHDFVLSM